jgi:hypothetical protein
MEGCVRYQGESLLLQPNNGQLFLTHSLQFVRAKDIDVWSGRLPHDWVPHDAASHDTSDKAIQSVA